jgi:hypothetical protein
MTRGAFSRVHKETAATRQSGLTLTMPRRTLGKKPVINAPLQKYLEVTKLQRVSNDLTKHHRCRFDVEPVSFQSTNVGAGYSMAASSTGCGVVSAARTEILAAVAPVHAPLFARLDIASRRSRLASVTNGAGATPPRQAIA